MYCVGNIEVSSEDVFSIILLVNSQGGTMVAPCLVEVISGAECLRSDTGPSKSGTHHLILQPHARTKIRGAFSADFS